MTAAYDWESGDGLLGIDDPAEVDAGRGVAPDCQGDAAVGRRPAGFAFTAAGHAARLNGELTPEGYAALRAEGLGGVADHPIRDTLGFVPFRKLPPWFKRRRVL